MTPVRLAPPILGLTATVLLAACSAGGPPSVPASPASPAGAVSSSAPGTSPAATGVPGGVPAGLGGLPGLSSAGAKSGRDALAMLPANFPLPSGATGVYGGTAGGATAVVFNVPDGSGAVAFYRDALPKAGFPLAPDSLGFPLGFTGTGITEGIIGVSGNAVGISIYGTFTAGGGSASGGSASSGSGSGSGTIIISRSSTPQTMACNNATVEVRADSDPITLTGHCHAINVSGDSDDVVAGSADSVTLSGDADSVTVHSGSPAVTKTGLDDVLQTG